MAAMFCLELAGKLEVHSLQTNRLLVYSYIHPLTLQHFETFHEASRFFQRAIDIQVNVSSPISAV